VIEQWEQGVYLEDGKTAPCKVRIMRGNPKIATLQITMTEGKNRQIRRIASMLGYPVHRLKRTAIGRFELGELKPNQYKIMTEHDVNLMKTPSPELRLIPGAERKQRPFKGKKS
jgi:pseudouridine synthase